MVAGVTTLIASVEIISAIANSLECRILELDTLSFRDWLYLRKAHLGLSNVPPEPASRDNH